MGAAAGAGARRGFAGFLAAACAELCAGGLGVGRAAGVLAPGGGDAGRGAAVPVPGSAVMMLTAVAVLLVSAVAYTIEDLLSYRENLAQSLSATAA